MASPETAPRQVRLRRCSIWSPTLWLRGVDDPTKARLKTSGQDISASIVSLDIYESIFQNTLSGTVRFKETDGYPEYFPLVGTEYLLVEFVIDYLGDERVFAREFRIRKIGDQSFPQREERLYTLELVSPEFFKSMSSRMTQRHQKTCTDAVKSIMEMRLGIDKTRIDGEDSAGTPFVEKTSGTIDVLIPNYTPLQAINYFTALALTEKTPYASNFLFYETLDGFYFKSIRGILQKYSEGKEVATFEVNAHQLTGSQNINEDQAFNSIIRLQQEQMFDVLSDVTTGVLRSRMLHLDFFARQFSEVDSGYTETFKKFKDDHLAEYPLYPENFEQSVDKNTKLFTVLSDTSSSESPYRIQNEGQTAPNRIYESVMLRNRQLREIQHLRTVLEVPGQPNLRAGTVVILNYPSTRLIADTDTNLSAVVIQHPTPFHSGRHLVTAVRHNLVQISTGIMEYRMHIEATRDSLGSALTPYPEDTTDVDTPR
jgi:hypothetical protein